MKYDPKLGFWDEHPPGASLDYGFDWAKNLKQDETVSASTWTSSAGDLSRQQIDGTKTSVFFSNGVEGETYYLVNTVTTSENRVFVLRITLLCKHLTKF